jgi:hypothetical protein
MIKGGLNQLSALLHQICSRVTEASIGILSGRGLTVSI